MSSWENPAPRDGLGPVGRHEAADRAGHLIGDLRREVAALAARYRRLPESRLRRRLLPSADAAAVGRDLAQRLAAWAQAVEERDAPVEDTSVQGASVQVVREAVSRARPLWRRLPDHGPYTVGDQIAVTGFDLLTAVAGLPGDTVVEPPDGRRDLVGLLEDAVAACRDLRMCL